MIRRAPNFYEKQFLSAEIHMNALIRSVNDANGNFRAMSSFTHGPVGSYFEDNDVYIYENTYLRHHSTGWYVWVTIELKPNSSIGNPEDYLFVYSDNGTGSWVLYPIAEKVVQGKFVHCRFNNNPHDFAAGTMYQVKIETRGGNVSADCTVYPPYEYSVPGTPLELHDFLTGIPTLSDWQLLTSSVNDLLDIGYLINMPMTSIKKEGEISRDFGGKMFSCTHKNSHAFIDFQIRWPEITEPTDGSEWDVLCTYDNTIEDAGDEQLVFHRGRYLTSREGADPVVCFSKLEAKVGDRANIAGENGFITSIIYNEFGNGRYSFYIDWDNQAPVIIQYMDSLAVSTHMDYKYIDIKVRPKEEESGYHDYSLYNYMVDLAQFNIPKGDWYSFKFFTKSNTPSGVGSRSGDLIVSYIGETINLVTGEPEDDWLKMSEWNHLDVVPGTGDRAINNIVENIRLLQTLPYKQQNVAHYRKSHGDHFDLCFNHRYRWLGISLYPSGGEFPEPVIRYWNGQEWMEDSLSYDNDIAGFQYIDLSEFSGLYEGSFYTCKNTTFAYELDFTAEL